MVKHSWSIIWRGTFRSVFVGELLLNVVSRRSKSVLVRPGLTQKASFRAEEGRLFPYLIESTRLSLPHKIRYCVRNAKMITQTTKATITETRKTVLRKCQGLSSRDSPRLVQLLHPPFPQGMLPGCGAVDVATLLIGGVTFTSFSSVSSVLCASAFVNSNRDGLSI